VRSRITAWARSASFQSAGFSAALFSSPRRATAWSQSKMPPQQGQALLDLFHDMRQLGSHGGLRSVAAWIGAPFSTAAPAR
jgi:hypothetical protein